MTHPAPVTEVTDLLGRLAIPYMVVGSVAALAHGADRSTVDIDLVVELDAAAVERLLAALDRDRWYVPEEMARASASDGGSLNLIDLQSELKVDLIARRDRPFSREEFARRSQVDVAGLPVWVATAEDTVLSKLEWGRAGGSDRQVEDAAAVLAVSGPSMDRAYLDRWARELGVADLLDEARRRAGLG